MLHQPTLPSPKGEGFTDPLWETLNNVDPQRYLQYVLERIADHPINRVEELLPWNVADELNQPDQVTQALTAA
jgi:IS66 C-terminal element